MDDMDFAGHVISAIIALVVVWGVLILANAAIMMKRKVKPEPERKLERFTVYAVQERAMGYMLVGIPVMAYDKQHAEFIWQIKAEKQRRRLFTKGMTSMAVELNMLTGEIERIEDGWPSDWDESHPALSTLRDDLNQGVAP